VYWNCLIWLRIAQDMGIQSKGSFCTWKTLNQTHVIVPWANTFNLQFMYIWRMGKMTLLIKLDGCEIHVLICAKLFILHQMKQLVNGFTILMVCNDTFNHQALKLKNVISNSKYGYPNHFKMTWKFGGLFQEHHN